MERCLRTLVFLGLIPWLVFSCLGPFETSQSPRLPEEILTARLLEPDTGRGWKALRRTLHELHPTHRLEHQTFGNLRPSPKARVCIVTHGSGMVGIKRQSTRLFRSLGPGDLIFLQPGHELSTAAEIEGLVLSVPTPFPDALETLHTSSATPSPAEDTKEREGWTEERIDILGGSAGVDHPTHPDVNVKRVHLAGAPTHYHPPAGGYDELVFILDAEAGAQVLWSDHREAIESRRIAIAEVGKLFRSLPITKGDLLLVPRGVVHKPLGRSRSIVLALPGFLPEATVLLDEDLRAIALELGLRPEKLPWLRREP